jgi:hypothetical protein
MNGEQRMAEEETVIVFVWMNRAKQDEYIVRIADALSEI